MNMENLQQLADFGRQVLSGRIDKAAKLLLSEITRAQHSLNPSLGDGRKNQGRGVNFAPVQIQLEYDIKTKRTTEDIRTISAANNFAWVQIQFANYINTRRTVIRLGFDTAPYDSQVCESLDALRNPPYPFAGEMNRGQLNEWYQEIKDRNTKPKI